LREHLDDHRIDEVIKNSAKSLTVALGTNLESGLAAQSALSLFSMCDDRTRQQAMEGVLDVKD
jgi:hypothetical protein